MIVTTTKNTPLPIPALDPETQEDHLFLDRLQRAARTGGRLTLHRDGFEDVACDISGLGEPVR